MEHSIKILISNIFGIIPIYSLIMNGRYYGALLTTVATIASSLMNATNTQHNLPILCKTRYSHIIKNIEGIIAKITCIYGLYLFYSNAYKNIFQVILPISGGIALFKSDNVNSLKEYEYLQIFWHICIFTSLYLVTY
jgi:hypothetical protein